MLHLLQQGEEEAPCVVVVRQQAEALVQAEAGRGVGGRREHVRPHLRLGDLLGHLLEAAVQLALLAGQLPCEVCITVTMI